MFTTLYISTDKIRFLSVNEKEVVSWDSVSLPPGMIRNGTILQPQAVGAMINSLLGAKGISKKRVISTIAGLPFTYRLINMPKEDSATLHKAILRAAEKEMPLPLEDLYLSWQAYDGEDNEWQFLILGVAQKPIDTLAQTLSEAGIKPYLFDFSPLALARVADRRDAIVVDLEPGYFQITLIAGGLPAVMHTLPLAEEGASVQDKIKRLSDALSKITEFYNDNHPQNTLVPTIPLLLTGELSSDTLITELIQESTGYQVEPLASPFEAPPEFPVASFTSNMGLALKNASLTKELKGKAALSRDINLNEITKGKVRADGLAVKRLLLPIALLVGIGLLIFAYPLQNQAEAEVMFLQGELQSASQELDQRLLSVSNAEQIKKSIDEIAANVYKIRQEHQSIMSKGDDLVNNLKFLTQAVPDNSYFTYMGIQNDRIVVEGEADNPFTIVQYVTNLEASGNYSEVLIAYIDDSKSAQVKTPETANTGVVFKIIITKRD